MASITLTPVSNMIQTSTKITGNEKLVTIGPNGNPSTVSVNSILNKIDDSIADRVEDQVMDQIMGSVDEKVDDLLDDKIDEALDLSNYFTKEQVNTVIETSVGNLNTLTTTNKENVVAAINEVKGTLEQTFAEVASALDEKQPLLTGDEFKTINGENIMGKGNIELPKVEIVNDLTTGGADKALSAKQGKVLKEMIPSKVSELENDSGYLTEIPEEYINSISELETTTTSFDKNNVITNIRKENLGATDYTFKSTYASVPTQRRGVGAIFTNYINENASYNVTIGGFNGKNTSYFNLIVDGKIYKIDTFYPESSSEIAQRIANMSFPNWDITYKSGSTTLTFNKTIKGIGTISTDHTSATEYISFKLKFTLLDDHSNGSLTFTTDKETITVDVDLTDTQESLMQKIKSKFKSYSTEQHSLNEVSVKYISQFNTPTTLVDYKIDGISGLEISLEDIKPFQSIGLTVVVSQLVATEGANKISAFIQHSSGTNDSLSGNKSNFREFAFSEDINAQINNTLFPLISDWDTSYSNIPSAKRNIGALLNKNGTNYTFAGPISKWSDAAYWIQIAETKQLFFKGGIAVFAPKKDSYGGYIHGRTWVFSVTKELLTDTVIRKGYNTTGVENIKIPVGDYEVYTGNGGSVLWWNVITKSVEFGTPSNASACYAICRTAENYPDLVSIKSFRGVASISQYKRGAIQRIPITKGDVDTLNVLDILPTDFTNYNVSSEINSTATNVNTIYFPAGEYKMSDFFLQNKKIKGDGIDKTILRYWDFAADKDRVGTWANSFGGNSGIHYSDMTLLNRGFQQYAPSSGGNATFENVKIKFTLDASGGYLMYVTNSGFRLTLKNFEIEATDVNAYAGIYIASDAILDIDNVKVGTNITKPFVGQGIASAHVKKLHTTGGQTGIFFGAQKNTPLDGLVVENCIAEDAAEECMSFDTYGNNVGLCPVIAELSIKEATIETIGSTSYYHNRLKVYCDARVIVGSHPNEYYQNYLFEEKEDYIKQFYVVFSQLAGDVFAGTVAKIIDVGSDDKGQFLILNTQLSPEKLLLLSNTDINSSSNSNYQVASIMSGFFNCNVRNNIIRRGRNTGLALYCTFYKSVVEGNRIENCRRGSYLYAGRMLAKPTWCGADGNTIVNNTFEGGDSYGFEVIKFADIKGHNNIVANNQIINSKGLSITGEENFLFEGNNIVGEGSSLTINKTNSSTFGEKYPVAPRPGQRFFNTLKEEEKIWNGSEWI